MTGMNEGTYRGRCGPEPVKDNPDFPDWAVTETRRRVRGLNQWFDLHDYDVVAAADRILQPARRGDPGE